jgi:hypothetical protein
MTKSLLFCTCTLGLPTNTRVARPAQPQDDIELVLFSVVIPVVFVTFGLLVSFWVESGLRTFLRTRRRRVGHLRYEKHPCWREVREENEWLGEEDGKRREGIGVMGLRGVDTEGIEGRGRRGWYELGGAGTDDERRRKSW